MEYETRTLKISVGFKGNPIFDEHVTDIEIDDEAAGEFVSVIQDENKIWIDPSQWPILREAIDRMVKECREYGNN